MSNVAQPGDSFTYYEARRHHDLTEGRGGMVTMGSTLSEERAYRTCRGWGVQGQGDGQVLRVTVSADEHGVVTTQRVVIYGDIRNEKGVRIGTGWLDGRDTPAAVR
jgi:hypothetical protein